MQSVIDGRSLSKQHFLINCFNRRGILGFLASEDCKVFLSNEVFPSPHISNKIAPKLNWSVDNIAFR